MAVPFLTNIDLNQNEALNLALHNATANPTSTKAGQIYFNTSSGRVLVYNGSAWVSIAGDIHTIDTTGSLTASETNGTVTIGYQDNFVIQGDLYIGAAEANGANYKLWIGAAEVISATGDASDGGIPALIEIGDLNADDVPVYFKQSDSTVITLEGPRTVGIGTTTPSNLLELQTESGSGVTGSEGIFVKAAQAGSQPVTGYKNPFISIGTAADESVNAYATLYLGSNASATGQESKIEWSDDDFKLSIWATGTSLLKHVEFGDPGQATAKTEFFGNVIVGGNLTINGTTTTVNSTTVTIDDPVFTLGGDAAPESDDNKDRGIEFRYHDGTSAKLGFFGYDDSTEKFTFLTDATNTSEVFSGTTATIVANLEGNVNGNATNITTSASTSVAGKVELATSAETIIGTDTSRAVTPDSLAARSVVATIDVSDSTLTGQTAPYKATITHSLGTKDLIVQLQDVTDFAVVHADISTTDFAGAESANKITIGFDNALPANNIRVIITSARGATGGTVSYS